MSAKSGEEIIKTKYWRETEYLVKGIEQIKEKVEVVNYLLK